MSDWGKGNAYEFQAIEKPEIKGWAISNGHYMMELPLLGVEYANVICKVLNNVQIGNEDGISRKELLKKLDEQQGEYMKYQMTLSEAVLIERIFNGIRKVIQ